MKKEEEVLYFSSTVGVLTGHWVQILNEILQPENMHAVIVAVDQIDICNFSDRHLLKINVEPNGNAWFYYPFPFRVYLRDLSGNKSVQWLINILKNQDLSRRISCLLESNNSE